MQLKKSKRLYSVTLEFANGVTRDVEVKASTREIAERRALKFNSTAIGIKKSTLQHHWK